jgi:hypothetical protein
MTDQTTNSTKTTKRSVSCRFVQFVVRQEVVA